MASLFVPASVDDYGLSASQFRVLCHIARRGECYSTVATIANVCLLSPKTVRSALRELRSQGLVVAKPRHGQTTIYRITDAHQRRSENGETLHPTHAKKCYGGLPMRMRGGLPNETRQRLSPEGYPHKEINHFSKLNPPPINAGEFDLRTLQR